SIEHGKLINNTEDPPQHHVGMFLNVDRFGHTISGKYLGQWYTDYTVDNLVKLSDGGLAIFLRSHSSLPINKIIRINKKGDIVWVTPLQCSLPSTEVTSKQPILKEIANGRLLVFNQYHWDIPDTLFYPFTPPILLLAPLTFMSFSVLDMNSGQILNQTNYESPSYTNTNVKGEFIPEVKSILELPSGLISVLIDVYYPIDDQIFYKHYLFSKRAMNFMLDNDGYLKNLITYNPKNNSCSLQSVWPENNGKQVLLVKDTTDQQLILFEINAEGQVQWSKSYKNPQDTPNSQGIVLQKEAGKGYSIFQSDPVVSNFQLLITNAIGNDSCTQLPAPEIIAQTNIWPWPFDKVKFQTPTPDIDFRYSPFNIAEKSHSITQNTYCFYQYQCCKDVIDSLHPHNISICESGTYTLPDNTTVNTSGTYYVTLKTSRGCDSVVLYNLKIIKSPSHLVASPDTCLENSFAVQLQATGGYDSYTWNDVYTSNDSTYSVHLPGNYSVTVDNMCGSKTDTINVYDHCDFPIYFPNAFTPNGDHLNDVLRVPPENRNKLIQLKVYNRWGQLVFSTGIIGKGWDGNFKGAPQPAGVFTYYLEMQGLSGHALNQKGTVVLIR
ncbi:MAG TPA: gliding motility-associated C-terminal domain-containing protein, partial [Chitinophagaceae bacterium]